MLEIFFHFCSLVNFVYLFCLFFSKAHFDRLGESELYRVDGTDGRVDDMTGRTIDTDDLYDQEERKVDLADQEVTFRTDQAIVAGMPESRLLKLFTCCMETCRLIFCET